VKYLRQIFAEDAGGKFPFRIVHGVTGIVTYIHALSVVDSSSFIAEDLDSKGKIYEMSWTEDKYKFYVEPKPKVKLYRYAYVTNAGRWQDAMYYFKDDEDFKAKTHLTADFMRLDNTMIEVGL